jgi:hypothetical protein
MTLPSLKPGQFALSVEFSHSPTQVQPGFYESDLEARSDAKEIFQNYRSVVSIALLGVKADGKVGVLDCFSFGAWDSDLFDLDAYEERLLTDQAPEGGRG